MTRLPLDAAALAALARKYAVLAKWRRARDEGREGPTAVGLRRMATRFPGSLRELDTLGLAELERRAESAEAAARTSKRSARAPDDWMLWIATVHALLRAVLAWRRQHGRAQAAPGLRAGKRPFRAGTDLGLTQRVRAGTGLMLTEREVARLLAPPSGRTLPVVLDLVARKYHVEPGALARRLFPSRLPRTKA